MNTRIADAYEKFLDELLVQTTKSEIDPDFEIFLSLFEMRTVLWKYCIKNNRMIDFSFSDIFQDLVAQYIKYLFPNYILSIELKQGRYRPDIIVYDKLNKIKAIIEIKTTVGWNRSLIQKKEFKTRIQDLAKEYCINQNQVFFIFESSSNVDSRFSKKIWEKNNRPYTNRIFPLFREQAHPNIMDDNRYQNNWGVYEPYTLDDIKNKYNQVKGNKLADILKKKGFSNDA